MSVNLNEQVLYSCHLSDDNRWHDGVFKYSVVDNILQVQMKVSNRGSAIYRRVVKTGMSRSYQSIASNSIPFYIVLFKDNGDSVLGFEFLALNTEDSSPSIFHSQLTWSFNLQDLGLIIGDKIKIMIVGILPEIKNGLYYDKDDMAFDLDGYKDNHSRVFVHKSEVPSIVTDHISVDGNFTRAIDDGVVVESETVEDVAYWLYSLGVKLCVKEWFSYTLVSGNTPPDVGEERQRFTRFDCNELKVYVADLFGEEESIVFNTELYDSGTVNMTTIYISDLDEDGCYSFTLSEDGLYEVTVINNELSVLLTDYIIEYCSLMTCYLDLINSIYCSDTDCCTGCSDEVIRDREFKKNELLKLRVFMSKVTFDLNYLRLASIGMSGPVETADLERIADYWDKIKEIVDRCGTCGDSDSTDSECSQCN